MSNIKLSCQFILNFLLEMFQSYRLFKQSSQKKLQIWCCSTNNTISYMAWVFLLLSVLGRTDAGVVCHMFSRLVCDRLLIVINNSIECNIFAFRDLTDFVFRPNMPRFPTFDKCCDILYSLTVFAITIAFQARSKACL